jgi:hypothetical protein
MLHELTITVDDSVYQALRPMVEQQIIGPLLRDFLQNHSGISPRPVPSIAVLRGSLQSVDTSDLREEDDRTL